MTTDLEIKNIREEIEIGDYDLTEEDTETEDEEESEEEEELDEEE